jgi:hypothetical protein
MKIKKNELKQSTVYFRLALFLAGIWGLLLAQTHQAQLAFLVITGVTAGICIWPIFILLLSSVRTKILSL